MKNLLVSPWMVCILLLALSAATICIWLPECWKLICAAFAVPGFDIVKLIGIFLTVSAIAPLLLTAVSFVLVHRSSSIFRIQTVLTGLVYSVLLAACFAFFFIMLVFVGFGIADSFPVQMKAASIFALISLSLFSILLLIDCVKARPTGLEIAARFLICMVYTPGLFLAVLVVWDFLCAFVDIHKL